MRRISCVILLLLAILAAFAAGGNAAEKNPLYRQQIFVDAGAHDTLTFADKTYSNLVSPKDSAAELAFWLEKSTGKKFNIGDAKWRTLAGDNGTYMFCF